jgi:tRNA-specific 2-thiouridylase
MGVSCLFQTCAQAPLNLGVMNASQVRGRAVVGLSGGVDSAVSAWILKEQGWDVVGLFMKNWEDDDSPYCSARQDWIDAVSVADVLGIDIEAVNFSAEYRDRVFAEFLREYTAGRTPNPDVLCNAEIKFKAFLDHALRLGAEVIATGHYARVRRAGGAQDGPVELLRGMDPGKDQSYFLHRLTQAQLARVVFPIGDLHKSEVRAIARRIGLPNAAKKDSTGICFIGERPFREFLGRYVPRAPGPIRTDTGRIVGEHGGLAFYTLGQRKGIGVGGQATGSGAPWYVARKDMAQNTLYVVQGHDHPWLWSAQLAVTDAQWVAGAPPDLREGLSAKTRYRQADAAVTLDPGRAAVKEWALRFSTPQWAVTPGQSAVLYRGDVCLGGGVITA